MQGERGAQLMTGIVDEGSLALHGRLEPIEHPIQGLAQPANLVVGR